MKRGLLILIILILPNVVWAELNKEKEFIVSALDAVKLAGKFVEHGDYGNALQILNKMPPLQNASLEIERWFLLAQIASRKNDFDTAIDIYKKILNAQPNLARVRFDLAVCYMKIGQWSRADYHLRLAMSGKDLPNNIKNLMNYYRYIIRQNKNWNIWFNFGAAPDNNINSSVGGEECVMTMFGKMCRQLPDPVSAIGFNFSGGGDYEFKLSDQWRWKSNTDIYTNVYNQHNFDDLYLSFGTGLRYIWSRGDVGLTTIGARRWYGWEEYNWSLGAKLDTNYDFNRKLSGSLHFRFMNNFYDDFGEHLDGQTYSATARLFYSLNSSMYLSLRSGIERETTKISLYSNWRPSAAIGFGAELPYGIHIYLEPSIYMAFYDAPRWTIQNDKFSQIIEHSYTTRYAISISNNKLDIWGFVPTLTFSYTKRESNIWQREYNKTAIEFSMQQRF